MTLMEHIYKSGYCLYRCKLYEKFKKTAIVMALVVNHYNVCHT